jgi:protein-tyrosine phosphatase
MKYLQFSLVQAYLFVRARRLNVIIQPNLKFMYEMLQLEQREKGTVSITWPILCNEVNNLNFAYRDTSSLP